MLGATPTQQPAHPPISATAFVDWRAQMHNAGCLDAPAVEGARQTLVRTARLVGRALGRRSCGFACRCGSITAGTRAGNPAMASKRRRTLSTRRISLCFPVRTWPSRPPCNTATRCLPRCRSGSIPARGRSTCRTRCVTSPAHRSRRKRWWTRPSRRICSRGHTSRPPSGRLCLPRTTTLYLPCSPRKHGSDHTGGVRSFCGSDLPANTLDFTAF